MPIKASADKLHAEISQYGCPPLFPGPPHFKRACESTELLAERQATVKLAAEWAEAEEDENERKEKVELFCLLFSFSASYIQFHI